MWDTSPVQACMHMTFGDQVWPSMLSSALSPSQVFAGDMRILTHAVPCFPNDLPLMPRQKYLNNVHGSQAGSY